MERKESISKEATSKQTTEDLEKQEATTGAVDSDDLPSPDGEFDEPEELKDADPL